MIALAPFDLASRRWRIGVAFREMSPATFWLLCWSLGGLMVMSLIPSKRVDRIFPVIPPLCLLLAAQIGNIFRHEQLRTRVYRWSAVALLSATHLRYQAGSGGFLPAVLRQNRPCHGFHPDCASVPAISLHERQPFRCIEARLQNCGVSSCKADENSDEPGDVMEGDTRHRHRRRQAGGAFSARSDRRQRAPRSGRDRTVAAELCLSTVA